MIKYKTEDAIFIASQYAEKQNPVVDSDGIDSVPMSSANKKKYEVLSRDDEKPFEFVQEVKFGDKYPSVGYPSGAVFTKEWAESYAKKANSIPLPGSAFGHTANDAAWKGERAENHLYVTAAKVDGDRLLLRHYVSSEMAQHEYRKLIKEIQSGLIATSIYGMTRFQIEVDEKKGTEIVRAVESMGNERNDLVEWNQAGMASKLVAISHQRAAAENNQGQGEASMPTTYTELIAALKALIIENRSDPLGVVKDLGLDISVMTADQKADLASYTAIKAKVEDPAAFIDMNISAQGEAFKTLKDASIESEFGKNPELKKMALDMFQVKSGGQKEITSEIERIKSLDSIKSVAAKTADGRDGGLVSGGTQEKGFWDSKETVIIGGKKNG